MNMLSKKMVVGLMAGAVLVTGAMGSYTAQAATHTNDRQEGQQKQGKHQPPKMDTEKVAQDMSTAFGVNKDEIVTAINNKKDIRDISCAAMLAKISGKSFTDVMNLKTDSNKWTDVEKTLGVSHEQVKAAQDDMMAGMLEKRAGVAKDKAASLLQNGYKIHDIASAGILAKTSGKDIDTVLSMKKINNSWKDVASALGVDEKTFHEAMKNAGPGIDGPQGGPPAEHPEGAPQGAQDNQSADAPQPAAG